MTEVINRVSSKALEKATGRSWDEWLSVLDEEGADKLPHKEIARLLKDKGYIENSWWCQMVANGYEIARGLRVIGETISSGFEIGVRKSLLIPADEAWGLITGPRGLAVWLGSISELNLTKGQTYRTAEGTAGEVRSISPGKRLRLTWQPGQLQNPSTLQLTITPNGKKTTISFHQEKLASETERDLMRRHWQKVLDRLEELINT